MKPFLINNQHWHVLNTMVRSPERMDTKGTHFARRLSKVFQTKNSGRETCLILPVKKQVKSWRKANRKMGWGIKEKEFTNVHEPPEITESDRKKGYIGTALFYGFGDDGLGNSDSVLSGKAAWEYAGKNRRSGTWKCEYIDFDRSDYIRLRPGAPARPKGFYFAKFRPGDSFLSFTVSRFRKNLVNETGCGPEGIQLITVTHRHFQKLMKERKMPFMALADYDVAPYGHNDFFDAAQIFYSNNVIGLGIGNVDQNYPLFGIPTLSFTSLKGEGFQPSPKETLKTSSVFAPCN